ncbi:hypothetical protein RIF29_33835 [Crotalaria pallida]|uniref:Uncharacterized protein n=1 Tax=Crotalaria pallida TaxID=3830 RepID=A0AAN9E8Q3_CROPI
MFVFCRRLRDLKKPFSHLNKQHYSKIDTREAQLRDQLDAIQTELASNPMDANLISAEREIAIQYDKLVLSFCGIAGASLLQLYMEEESDFPMHAMVGLPKLPFAFQPLEALGVVCYSG